MRLEPCASCTRSIGEGTAIQCRSCGRVYHERCWLPGCVEEDCSNEYAYLVISGRGPRGNVVPERLPGSVMGRRHAEQLGRVEAASPLAPPGGLPAYVHPGHVLLDQQLTWSSLGTWAIRPGPELLLLVPGFLLFFGFGGRGGTPGLSILGWILCAIATLSQWIRMARQVGGHLRVTLERDEVVVTCRAKELRIPKSARRLRIAPQRFLGSGYELRWSGPNWASRESRLSLGALSMHQRKTFDAWLAQEGASLARVASRASIEVRSATEHQTCPLCHDGVVGDLLERGACSNCGAHYHQACWEEFGGCALPSCRGLVAGARPREALRLLSSEDARSA